MPQAVRRLLRYTQDMNKTRPASAGFTLLELMMVVTVIGILATIAIPKLAGAMQKAKEGSLKGNLGTLRSAVSIYYADTEGQYPADLSVLTTNAKYIAAVPSAKGLTEHADSSAVLQANAADDAGGWVYNNVGGDPRYGSITINCTHIDTKGSVWTSY